MIISSNLQQTMSKKIIVDFDWRFAVFSFFGNWADMANAWEYLKILPEIFLDSFRFGWWLNYN